jgi:myo-inositol-1(or 4)-monophosphatase
MTLPALLLLTAPFSLVAHEAILNTAVRAARDASAIIAAKAGADVIATKAGAKDLLTAVDGECQRVIEAEVLAAHPSGHAFLGEESVPAGAAASASALRTAMSATEAEYLWIVDVRATAAPPACPSSTPWLDLLALLTRSPGRIDTPLPQPIDGTTNFVQSLPLVGVSIGVAQRCAGSSGDWELIAGVIADPFKDEIFSCSAGSGAFLNGDRVRVGDEALCDAVVATGFAPNERSLRPMVRGISAVGARARTVRMLGSAAIMLAWVACGRLSAYWEADLNAWDTAAGVLLVREAGGVVTELGTNGGEFGIASRAMIASNTAAHSELEGCLDEAGVTGLDDID